MLPTDDRKPAIPAVNPILTYLTNKRTTIKSDPTLAGILPKTTKKPVAAVAKKPVRAVVRKPVASAPVRVAGTSSAVPISHSTTQVTSKPTAAQAQAAYANGIPAGDPWNGLTRQEVSDIIKRSKTGVAVELDPQIQAIKDQANLTQKQAERLQQQQDLATNKAVAEQKELYSRLVNSLQGMQGQVAGNYEDTGNKVASNYSALQSALASRFGNAQSNTGTELNRLGLGDATNAANARTAADSNFLQGLAGTDAAAAQTSIGMSKDMAVQNLLNNIQNSQASGTRLTAQTLQDALAQTQARNSSTSDAITQLLSQANSLQGTRRGMEYEASSQLQDQLRSSKAAAQQQAFENAMAQANLGVKEALAGTDASYKGALGSAALTNASAAQTRATAAAQESAARAAATKAGVDYKALQLALDQSKAVFAQNTKNYGTGINGALGYMSAKAGNQPIKGGQTAYQIATNMFNDITNNVKGVKDLPSALADVQKRQKTNGYPQDLVNIINNALTMYYSGKK